MRIAHNLVRILLSCRIQRMQSSLKYNQRDSSLRVQPPAQERVCGQLLPFLLPKHSTGRVHCNLDSSQTFFRYFELAIIFMQYAGFVCAGGMCGRVAVVPVSGSAMRSGRSRHHQQALRAASSCVGESARRDVAMRALKMVELGSAEVSQACLGTMVRAPVQYNSLYVTLGIYT